MLRRYVVFLKQAKKFRYDDAKPAKPLSDRTITNHLIIIRTIYNRAISAKQASKNNYPFGADGKIAIKFSQSSKIGLDEMEIKALEELDLSQCKPIYNDARNIWLTEFYFAGMRVTDCLLLKWKDSILINSIDRDFRSQREACQQKAAAIGCEFIYIRGSVEKNWRSTRLFRELVNELTSKGKL